MASGERAASASPAGGEKSTALNALSAARPPIPDQVGDRASFRFARLAATLPPAGAGGSVDTNGLYTAPATVSAGASTDTLAVTDSLGHAASAKITINQALVLAPATLSLVAHGQKTFAASGGVPPYSFSVMSGGAGGTIDPKTGAYTAPATLASATSSDTILVTDTGAEILTLP